MSELTYPKSVELDGMTVSVRKMDKSDTDAIHKFGLGLPAHDLLYLRRDLTKRPVIEAWVNGVEAGDFESLVAFDGEDIVAYSGLFVDTKSWSSHVGEIRVLVGEKARGKGLGRVLIEETFLNALERGLEKIIAQMTPDQKGAIKVFEEMGFHGEALLKDHVKDREGEPHDILILSCNVERLATRLQSYR